MPTYNNTSSGKLFVNGEPIAEIKDVDFTEAPKEDPAKEDEPVLYFNNSPETKLQGEFCLTKRGMRRLRKE